MRGKLLMQFVILFPIRITPAHAGKTQNLDQFREKPEDHPRACGENFGEGDCDGVFQGSPPRMRGKHTRERLF